MAIKGYFLRKPKNLKGEKFLLITGYDFGKDFINLDADWREFIPWIVTLYTYREKAEDLDPVINKEGKSALEYPFNRIFLCPNSEKNRKFILKTIQKVIDITGKDKFLLDYFRFPNRKRNFYGFIKSHKENDFCYCKHCQRGFEETFGKSIFDAKEEEIIKFRTISINNFAKSVKEEFEDYEIYVTLRANKKQAYEWNGQDWEFLSKIFDKVFVMAYFSQEGGIRWLKSVLKDRKSLSNAEIIFLDKEIEVGKKYVKDFYVIHQKILE